MDPEKVTLRHFLDVAYSIFVDAYREAGSDILTALDQMHVWAQGDGEPTKDAVPDTADQLAQLNAMMR